MDSGVRKRDCARYGRACVHVSRVGSTKMDERDDVRESGRDKRGETGVKVLVGKRECVGRATWKRKKKKNQKRWRELRGHKYNRCYALLAFDWSSLRASLRARDDT